MTDERKQGPCPTAQKFAALADASLDGVRRLVRPGEPTPAGWERIPGTLYCRPARHVVMATPHRVSA